MHCPSRNSGAVRARSVAMDACEGAVACSVLLALGAGCQRQASPGGSRVEPPIAEAAVPCPPAPPPEPDAAPPFTCAARLEAARSELLQADFNPAKDTATWLQVSRPAPGELDACEPGWLMLNVFTEYSPDGDGYRTFEAELRPSPRKGARGWRLDHREVLDTLKEERLPERTWTREAGGFSARVHTRTEDRRLVALFERVARPALDDCLMHPETLPR